MNWNLITSAQYSTGSWKGHSGVSGKRLTEVNYALYISPTYSYVLVVVLFCIHPVYRETPLSSSRASYYGIAMKLNLEVDSVGKRTRKGSDHSVDLIVYSNEGSRNQLRQ